MCGIAGFLSPGSPVSTETLLEASLKYIEHRGPDDFGTYFDSSIGLGLAHARLSILDLSAAGHQPMESADGNYVVVFNGEIYNFQELRIDLEAQGYSFSSDSDTEVLLALYKQKGNNMLPLLNGIFSFAIWDKGSESLFLARDSHGVKPLYYSCVDNHFIFASEIKALIPFLSGEDQLDFSSIDRYLTFLWCPGAGTPFKSVLKLQPGQAMTVVSGTIQSIWSWYELPTYSPHNIHKFNADRLIHSTADQIRSAVFRQLVSDVPVGAFLSGGLDSSAVVAFARERNPDLRCFTIDVNGTGEEGFSDDLPYARRVASHLGVPLDVVQVDAPRMAAGLEEMVWQLDEPLADPASLNVFYISHLARQQGIKVLLSGAGGDDLFTGYRRHLALRTERFWSWLPRYLRSRLRYVTGRLPAGHPYGRRIRKAFSGAHLNGDARLVHYFRWIERSDLYAFYTPAFRSALREVQAEDPMLAFLAGLPKDTPPIERMLALEQRFFLSDHNLAYTDKMSMAAGVEVRVPFLDLELVEFASRIPSQYKQRGREGKWILKKAMEPYLPNDVIYRPKSGFGAPLRSWLRVELRDWLRDILSPERLRNRGLFDPLAVQCFIKANEEGKVDASYTLLSMACIEIWCRRFIDCPGSQSRSSV